MAHVLSDGTSEGESEGTRETSKRLKSGRAKGTRVMDGTTLTHKRVIALLELRMESYFLSGTF